MFGSEIISCIAQAKLRNEWLNSLPAEEAKRLREEYAIAAREDELHRRVLEIAEAGRPRNFWGK